NLSGFVTRDAAADSKRNFHDGRRPHPEGGSLFFPDFLFLVLLLSEFARIPNTEFHKTLDQLPLCNLSRLMAWLLDHRRAAALDLTRTKSGEDHKAILAVDVVGNLNQAVPPKEAIISSIRACWRDGVARPDRTIASRS